MVLHSRGCGRVARRRFTCWASRSSLWLPGGPFFHALFPGFPAGVAPGTPFFVPCVAFRPGPLAPWKALFYTRRTSIMRGTMSQPSTRKNPDQQSGCGPDFRFPFVQTPGSLGRSGLPRDPVRGNHLRLLVHGHTFGSGSRSAMIRSGVRFLACAPCGFAARVRSGRRSRAGEQR